MGNRAVVMCEWDEGAREHFRCYIPEGQDDASLQAAFIAIASLLMERGYGPQAVGQLVGQAYHLLQLRGQRN